MDINKIIKETIYIGIFIPKFKVQGALNNVVKVPHVTLKFHPTKDEIKMLFENGENYYDLFLIGYENNGKNEALHVDFGADYNGLHPINPHITLSWSDDSEPKNSRTLKFEDFEPEYPEWIWQQAIDITPWQMEDMSIPLCATKFFTGYLGFYLKGGEIVLLKDIRK